MREYDSGYGRYSVVHYPTYYVVVDLSDNNRIVYETRSALKAHRWAAARYKEDTVARQQKGTGI